MGAVATVGKVWNLRKSSNLGEVSADAVCMVADSRKAADAR